MLAPGIEMKSIHVEGAVVVADVRLSVNLTTLTVSEILSKMMRSHLQLVLILGDLRHAGVPERALIALENQKSSAELVGPSWFIAPVSGRQALASPINVVRCPSLIFELSS